MEKKQRIDAIIANSANKWSEEDRKALEALSDDQLGKIEGAPAATDPPAATPTAQPAAAPTAAPAAPAANSAPSQLSEEEWLRGAPASVQSIVANAKAREAATRADIIGKLTANTSCKFSKEQLEAMPTDTLELLAGSMGTEVQSTRPGPRQNSATEDQFPVPPTLTCLQGGAATKAA